MFIPAQVIQWFTDLRKDATAQAETNREVILQLTADLRSAAAERDILAVQLKVSQNHFDWLSQRVNVLEVERAQLIEKAYGIKIPVPEIIRTLDPRVPHNMALNSAMFEDLG